MSGNNNFLWGLIFFILFIWTLKTCASCGQYTSELTRANSSTQPQYNSTIVVANEQAANGLDLSRLSEIIKETKTAADFEKKLNTLNGINNLDLNEDKKVDYIKVTEYKINENKWGFSLTTEVEKNEEQEIASIEIEKTSDNVSVNVTGNEQVYGRNTHYNGFYSGTSFFFLGYLLASHRPYFSPFGGGFYPGYYSPYSPVSQNNYRQNVSRYSKANKTSSYKTSSLNPNKNKVANKGIKKSLKNPTTTQRSFQRTQRRAVGKGGFGRQGNQTLNRSSSPNRSYRSVRGSTFGRSSGGFGK